MEVNSQPDWVTIAEATGIVNRSERTIRRWVIENRIPHTRDGRRILVDVSMYRSPKPGTITDTTGMQGQVSYLQSQVDMLQAVVDRQDAYIARLDRQLEHHTQDLNRQVRYLQDTLARELERKALPAPKARLRWPWQKD